MKNFKGRIYPNLFASQTDEDTATRYSRPDYGSRCDGGAEGGGKEKGAGDLHVDGWGGGVGWSCCRECLAGSAPKDMIRNERKRLDY